MEQRLTHSCKISRFCIATMVQRAASGQRDSYDGILAVKVVVMHLLHPLWLETW